jgi:hypothetical protein
MSNSRRLAKFGPALALLALAVPSAAFGQATRTWVSGVGDDANPCSRTAPCKTFAGAISKTANGGEINCLDPGGFGGVTIGKSLTIKCHYTEGGVLVSGTNAIVVNATATDKVTLRGLDINGIGVGAPTSLVGVKVLGAKAVHIIDTEIYRFKAGIDVAPTTANTRVVVTNSHIHNNDIGVINAPGSAAGNGVITTLRNNLIADNVCGAAVGAFGTNASTPTTTDCGTASSASGINVAISHLLAYGNGIYENGTGLLARGINSRLQIGNNEVSTNTVGLARLDSGFIKSFGNNQIIDNGSTVAPNAPNDVFTKRTSKKARH